ncbi:MAG: MarR family transcriptional regulator, partial [Pseudomonadota bacterium]
MHESSKESRDETAERLRLEHFLPYRLSILSNTISGSIAAIYAERFDLSIPEWRVMAIVGRKPGLSAIEVAERAL